MIKPALAFSLLATLTAPPTGAATLDLRILETTDLHSSMMDFDYYKDHDGMNYQIDVSAPARYDGECQLINPAASRIKNLTWQGKPIDPDATFLIATNNYRAYGGKFVGTGDAHIAFAAPDENRSVVSAYISEQTRKHGEVKIAADNNWRLAPIDSDTKLDIRFETAPGEKAQHFIRQQAQYPMTATGNDDIGFAHYRIDLQQQ